MTDEQFHDCADPAAISLQKLHKKLRNWRNKGLATTDDLVAVSNALMLVRDLYRRRGVPCPDIDSQSARKAKKGEISDD